LNQSDELFRSATFVLSQNIIHGDALLMRTKDGQPITFAEWGYLGKGKFQRRDFRLEILTHSAAFRAPGSLFSYSEQDELFEPTKIYPPMTARDLAAASTQETPTGSR